MVPAFHDLKCDAWKNPLCNLPRRRIGQFRTREKIALIWCSQKHQNIYYIEGTHMYIHICVHSIEGVTMAVFLNASIEKVYSAENENAVYQHCPVRFLVSFLAEKYA